MKKPNIILFDIETSPNHGYVWGKYDQNVLSFTKEWELLSFAFKVLGRKETAVVSRREVPSEKLLVKGLWRLLNCADVIIAHNGDEFDIKKAYAKFAQFGLGPPKPFQKIDTKKLAKRHFNFTSNSLDDLGRILGVGRKEKTGGFDLWLDCMAGKAKAWKKMENYNKKDVELLERVYLKLRPYAEQHPNVAFLSDNLTACPKCGSEKLESRGIGCSKSQRYRKFQCKGCGGWCRARLAEKSAKPEVV